MQCDVLEQESLRINALVQTANCQKRGTCVLYNAVTRAHHAGEQTIKQKKHDETETEAPLVGLAQL